ncbi:MAG: DegV family protein [Clostridiales bacterium]|nr:DegV family protein [Clostridiales bacterium]
MSVAIVTDSNSGITQQEAAKLGISVIPMPFYINDELYFEDITIDQPKFYEFLAADADVHTSMPSPADVMDIWDRLLEEYDEIVYIPMSSGLSSSCETAIMLARDEKYEGKVFVVDNQRISVSQARSALEAKELADAGCDAQKIYDVLMKTKLDAGIYIFVDTMKYLKKGGRVTPAAAGIATVLNIKPVLQIQGGKLDVYSKARGIKSAKKELIKAIHNDIEGRFKYLADMGQLEIDMAYTGDEADSLIFLEEIKNEFPGLEIVRRDPLSLSVSCHIGPGALALVCVRKIDVSNLPC